ncbi:nitrogen fixation protein NifQ [Hyphomicrobium sp. MC1]|uniref:nitrogen fixation protein NifQ n=1 Tax=Hyphomicrobium sp. (strain MC1) TaxID=717785 RepID=UPI0002E291A6|nr:nitrogen fixation protein NifQ [Hyphomicrobium sp. MC1]
MKPEDAYRWLINAAAASYDAFDIHVVSAILALALADARIGNGTILEGTGLDKSSFSNLAIDMFPDIHAALDIEAGDAEVVVDDEEQSIRDILTMFASGAGPLERSLVAMIARRCKWPHHLWQDLGLRNRGELSTLMKRHFSRLADRNRQDMKWKKFLYRMVCGSEGFVLCTAPVCSECDDFKICFGAEDGESRLAWARNAPATAA